MNHLLFLSLFLLSLPMGGLAKNYALVISGPSVKNEPKHHEFAFNHLTSVMGLEHRGYEVQSLFGSLGLSEELSPIDRMLKKPPEQEKYKIDYQKIQQEIPHTVAASRDNILRAFKNLAEKVNSEDKVVINLEVHGTPECDRDVNSPDVMSADGNISFYRDDYAPNCRHYLSVKDEQGKDIKMETKDIVPFLQQMDEKGTEVNLLVGSCFGGLIKKDLTKLRHTCTILSASGNAVGHHCFESDADDNLDYSAVSNITNYALYHPIINQLQQDPYFQSLKCFHKVKKHAEKMPLDFAKVTLEDLFWEARKASRSFDEPSYSEIFHLEYFKRGRYADAMMQIDLGNDEICPPNIFPALYGLEDLISQSNRAVYFGELEKFAKSIDEYNSNMQKQKGLLAKARSEDKDSEKVEQFAAELSSLQEEANVLGIKVMEAERNVADFIRQQIQSGEKRNCNRSI